MAKKSKSAKQRQQLSTAYFAKAAAAEKPVAEKSTILLALDFAMSACADTTAAESGLAVKTLRNLQKGYPLHKAQEEGIMNAATKLGFKPEATLA